MSPGKARAKASPTDLRERLVDRMKAGGHVRTAAVEAAFRTVPRHDFLPDVGIEDVYTDRAFPIKHADGRPISSSSQPAIMAIMLEQLALAPGYRVLEIGAGTGYNAALIAEIVGKGGQVVAIDIDDDLVLAARQHLATTGFDRVEVRCADGGYGYPERAPFDRIIITASAWDIAPAWFEQLALGGRLVLPLSLRQVQQSVAFERHEHHLESASVADCGFMPLRGAFAGPERVIPLGPTPGPFLLADGDRPIDADALTEALSASPVEMPAGLTATRREAFGSLSLWLALQDSASCLLSIYANASDVDRSAVPLLIEWPAGDKKQRLTRALLGEKGLVALSRSRDAWIGDGETPVPLSIVSLRGESELVERMRTYLLAWDRAGRPRTDALRISAYPKGQRVPAPQGARVLEKRWTTLVVARA
ncbi:MAG TPA: methyltransferase, FxLD system [Candidatus Dormibacteraeota bacterium]|nr:methyltransferase, FxLD system [Candidatus Dormibacteraeota bacterium]